MAGGYFYHYDEHDVIARIAGEDLSTSQFRAVKRNSNGEAVRATAGDSYGLLLNNPKKGEEASILKGAGAIGPAVVNGTVARDAKLVSDASGRLVAVAPGSGVTAPYQYRAEEPSNGASGAFEVRRLALSGTATAAGDATIVLNGVTYTVAIADTDTAAQAATKIRNSANYTPALSGWAVAGSGANADYTASTVGPKTGTFSVTLPAGLSGSFSQLTAGIAEQVVAVRRECGAVVG